jgi:serine/threonine protein kinase
MQFNLNSDFPASTLHPSQWAQVARPPGSFDPADFVPCACITTRVLSRRDAVSSLAHDGDSVAPGDESYHVVVAGMDYVVKTAGGVLVRTAMPSGRWSDSSDDDDDDDADEDDAGGGSSSAPADGPQAPPDSSPPPAGFERAYWLRRTLRAAIYGNVRYGIVLHKLHPPIPVMLPDSGNWVAVEWEETHECVAIKEMSWEHMRSQRAQLVEDPIQEVAAMQYLSRWYLRERQQQNSIQLMRRKFYPGGVANFDIHPQLAGMNLSSSPSHLDAPLNSGGMGVFNAGALDLSNIEQWIGQKQGMLPPQASPNENMTNCRTPQDAFESHIMMPMDLLSDDRYLYSVMPYCSGGELYDVLEKKSRLKEPEARYWMRQLLRGLTCLKSAGVSHRDLSLENLLVHEGRILVIDMGMCLRVPIDNISGRRYLFLPQGVCGKWHYMSPEVCKNQLPFDGPAVDLWAAGVILFLMLMGVPPWERPDLTDDRFRYMSSGYLVQMLTEWQVGLSGDAMDLLQRMFWLDPTDRLSLEQVCAHPWMSQGLPEYCLVDQF